MTEEKKPNDDDKKELDKKSQEDQDIDIEELNDIEQNVSIKEILDQLMKDDSFEEEIEQLLANLNEQTMDLTKLQTQILILIKRQLKSEKLANLLKDKDSLQIDEKQIAENLQIISHQLMNEKSDLVKNATKGLGKGQDKYHGMGREARQNFRKLLKNFAVYEIYKVMNPRRIAGETRRDNFVHNMITGGLGKASQYAGGTKHELATYSPKFIKELEAKHKAFKRGGGISL